MKQKSLIKKIAKKIFQLSFVEGVLDENRIRKILLAVSKNQRNNTSVILSYYKRLIEAHITKQQLVIEVPKDYSVSQTMVAALIKKTKTKVAHIIEDNKISFGARITAGDWIYDNTANAKLTHIKNNI